METELNAYKFGHPGPNSETLIPGYSAQFATENDLKEIDELGTFDHFYSGLPVLSTYFNASPKSFVICRETATGTVKPEISFCSHPDRTQRRTREHTCKLNVEHGSTRGT